MSPSAHKAHEVAIRATLSSFCSFSLAESNGNGIVVGHLKPKPPSRNRLRSLKRSQLQRKSPPPHSPHLRLRIVHQPLQIKGIIDLSGEERRGLGWKGWGRPTVPFPSDVIAALIGRLPPPTRQPPTRLIIDSISLLFRRFLNLLESFTDRTSFTNPVALPTLLKPFWVWHEEKFQ